VDEDRFWQLVGRRRTVAALRRLDGPDILAFHDRLRTAVAALDTPAHRDQPVADVSGGTPRPLSDDGFQDARLAVVAAGRARWAEVVADPARLAGVWPLVRGEELGRAAADAYEAATGDPWPDLSLDTATTGLPPISRWRWMHLDTDPSPAPYEEQLRWLEETLAGPEWERWWDAGSGHDGSSVACSYRWGAAGRRRSSVRVGVDPTGRVEVRVAIRVPPPRAADGWAAVARTHAELLLDVLRTKLGLGDPPELPPAAELARGRLEAARRAEAEAAAFSAWNLERTTAVPNLWAGRAPAAAIDELVTTLENGGRVRLPGLIAAMRARYGIAATAEDARQLAGRGYSPAEIETALGG
jgi:hypothetical protein